MRKLVYLLPALSLLWGCSSSEGPLDSPIAGGPGSETTNGFAYVDGRAAAFASVAIRSADYVSTSETPENVLVNADVHADSLGQFTLPLPKKGNYRLTVVHDGAAYSEVYSKDELKNLDSINLEPMAFLGGKADIPEKCDFVWVGVRGMDVLVRSDSLGNFQLPSLPANDSLDVYFMRDDDRDVIKTVPVILEPYASGVLDVDIEKEGAKKADFVVKANGKAASFAMVALRDPKAKLESPVLNNTIVDADFYSDEKGRFNFALPDSGTFRFTVTQSGFAYSKVLSVKQIAALDTLELPGTATFPGKVTLESGSNGAWVGVYGLDILVKADKMGMFTLPSLPAGDSLKLYFYDEKYENLYVEQDVLLEPFASDFAAPSMLLQDFEPTSSLDDWYFSVDTVGSSRFPMNIVNAIEYDSTRKSQVFHGKYMLKDDNYAWVLVGAALRGKSWNLSQLDSIVFYAKGNGRIRAAIENWDKESEEAGVAVKAASEWMDLGSKWTRYVVKPAQDLCYTSQDLKSPFYAWLFAQNGAHQLHFFARDGSEFYVDDIWLYGTLF